MRLLDLIQPGQIQRADWDEARLAKRAQGVGVPLFADGGKNGVAPLGEMQRGGMAYPDEQPVTRTARPTGPEASEDALVTGSIPCLEKKCPASAGPKIITL